jgi:hypothetical protein
MVLVIANLLGLFFAYVDSRPTWDDTGVLVFGIATAAASFGFIRPERLWLWALAIGGWVPAYNIANSGQFASLIAVPFAAAGTYLGAGLRKLMIRSDRLTP